MKRTTKMTRVYRAYGDRKSAWGGGYGPSQHAYTTPEEAWMRAEDDGIIPRGIESQIPSTWTREAYTPPSDDVYLDLYVMYVEGILGD